MEVDKNADKREVFWKTLNKERYDREKKGDWSERIPKNACSCN